MARRPEQPWTAHQRRPGADSQLVAESSISARPAALQAGDEDAVAHVARLADPVPPLLRLPLCIQQPDRIPQREALLSGGIAGAPRGRAGDRQRYSPAIAKDPALPRLFVVAGRPRSLLLLLAMTLLSGAAMLPAMRTMADHGASLIAFENAGSVARSQEILAGWGAAGKAAMWWQLALDMPFLVGYGFFIAGACAAVARRAGLADKPRLRRAAVLIAWCGPLAAGADFLQNVSLALILSGRVTQPWPRIAAVSGTAISIFMGIGLVFALVGVLATRTGRARALAG